MLGDFKHIRNLYREISELPKLGKEYCVAFVYNSAEFIRDTVHATECIYPNELHMILSSFRASVEYVYPFDGENTFIANIPILQKKHNYVLVYSMAQNVNGIGRRCIVPLACDYYDLINIGADFMTCVYGGSKALMYEKTKCLQGVTFPESYYIFEDCDLENLLKKDLPGQWLLKPNDESASIGVEVFSPKDYSKEALKNLLTQYKKRFPIFCVQEYIEGEEVAVPLFWFQGKYYCPGVSEVVFQTHHHYLDYDTIALGNCSYKEYDGLCSERLVNASVEVAKALNYRAISRIDFRIKDGVGYIEDIGPNPTISEHNGANELFRLRLNAKGCCVYQLMLYSALENNGLFKPTLNNAP